MKYHINDQLAVKECTAKKPENCIFYSGDKNNTNHYETFQEAKIDSEKKLKLKYGAINNKQNQESKFKKNKQKITEKLVKFGEININDLDHNVKNNTELINKWFDGIENFKEFNAIIQNKNLKNETKTSMIKMILNGFALREEKTVKNMTKNSSNRNNNKAQQNKISQITVIEDFDLPDKININDLKTGKLVAFEK